MRVFAKRYNARMTLMMLMTFAGVRSSEDAERIPTQIAKHLHDGYAENHSGRKVLRFCDFPKNPNIAQQHDFPNPNEIIPRFPMIYKGTEHSEITTYKGIFNP